MSLPSAGVSCGGGGGGGEGGRGERLFLLGKGWDWGDTQKRKSMQDVELGGGQRRGGGEEPSVGQNSDLKDGEDDGWQRVRGEASLEGCSSASSGGDGASAAAAAAAAAVDTPLSVVISQQEDVAVMKVGVPGSIDGRVGSATGATAGKDERLVAMAAPKRGIPRSDSYHEQCRVCQQQSDEPLIHLGCGCRGELAKAHSSCIEMWFRTKGSNKCEICQQVATNVPSPVSQPSTNYWIWRVDPAFGGSNMGRAERERGCFSPLWIAFCILIGGLLLDVLISVSFGVSALPVNIIIGVLIVLGLGTALRLTLECCHQWNMRRIAQRAAEAAVNPGNHSNV